MRRVKPKKFQRNIFVSLLITGIFQVILISFFMIIFASRLIEDSYRTQSNKKIMLLTEKLNMVLQKNTESSR